MKVIDSFKIIYQSKKISLATAFAALIYYLFIEYLITLSATNGFVFVTTPIILIYFLAISSAMLLVISIYSIRLSLSKVEPESVGAFSFVTAAAGGILAGCNCQAPILASVLYLFAFNAATVSTVIAFVGNNQAAIFSLLIILNVAISYYHLHKISASCAIKGGRLVRIKGRK